MVSAVWMIFVSISFLWNYVSSEKEQKTIAFQTARSFFAQIVITRDWNADHGGVYIPVTNRTPPNPYLEVPLKNIEVNRDLTLTLINPAYMTRQLSEIAETREGIHFHITSLKPIRPENTATPSEKQALESFDQGVKEVGEFIHGGSTISFFYMAPLKTERACLKCHAKQGYKEGDIIGGIRISLPFVKKTPFMPLMVGHVGVGLSGLLIIIILGTKLHKHPLSAGLAVLSAEIRRGKILLNRICESLSIARRNKQTGNAVQNRINATWNARAYYRKFHSRGFD